MVLLIETFDCVENLYRDAHSVAKKQVYIVINKVNGKCIDQNVPNINKFTQLRDAAKGFFADLMDHNSYNYRSICQYHSLLPLIF